MDLAVTGGRDVRPSATSFDKIDDSAGVIAPVSDEVSIRFEPFDQVRISLIVSGDFTRW